MSDLLHRSDKLWRRSTWVLSVGMILAMIAVAARLLVPDVLPVARSVILYGSLAFMCWGTWCEVASRQLAREHIARKEGR